MPKLIAIVTAYNRADFVEKCLRSILDAANEALQVEVILLDNGSTDETPDVVRSMMAQYPEGTIRLLRTEDNRKVVGVINRGLEAALEDPAVDYIVYMNEDTEYTDGSLNRLVAACDSHPNSILTPLQLNYHEPDHIDDSAFGHVQMVRPLIEDAILGRPLKQTYPIPTIIGAAMFARAEVWRNVGLFDPLFWFYGIDDDFCTRARWLGYDILLAPQAQLYHAHGKLGVHTAQRSKASRDARWRNEVQARYLFLLKDPKHALLWNCLRAGSHALATSLRNLRIPWLWGARQSLSIYLRCLLRYPAIAQARRRHFRIKGT